MRRLVLSCLLACAGVPSAAEGFAPPPTVPASQDAPEAAAVPQDKAPLPLIVIDPGHGGKDTGARAGGRLEAELVLQISRKVRDHLERSLGVRARLTRDGDEFVGLTDRVLSAEAAKARVFVSIHIDKAARRRSRGVTAYVYGRNRHLRRKLRNRSGARILPAPPGSQVSQSCRLATRIRRGLLSRGLRTAPFVDRARFAVLRSPDIPSVLLEVGNLRDKTEAARLSDPAFQERLAASLAAGLADYLKERETLALAR